MLIPNKTNKTDYDEVRELKKQQVLNRAIKQNKEHERLKGD